MSYSTTLLNGEKVTQGETNETISKKVGFDHRIVSRIFKGDREIKISQLEDVASALNLEVVIEIKPKAETVSQN